MCPQPTMASAVSNQSSVRAFHTSLIILAKALPHESIEAAELYRHINAELSDPNRMRQLLVWCAERSATRSHGYRQDLANDINQLSKGELRRAWRRHLWLTCSFMIVDEIQTEVIEALLDKALNVSWYHRPVDILLLFLKCPYERTLSYASIRWKHLKQRHQSKKHCIHQTRKI